MPNRVLWGNVKKSGKLEDLSVYGRIILKLIVNKMGKCEPDSSS